MTLRHVDLCSGIGGFALGFEWAKLSKPVLFCDIEPWSRQILAKHWPDVPIADDVKELANDPDGLVPDCDILTAGYPCQPFSLAGERRGTEDDRHIWPYIFSIIQRKRPSFCVFENVFGHVSMGLDEVLSDLEGESYATRAFIVPACAVDAPHRRDRLWIICRNVADTDNSGDRASRRRTDSIRQKVKQGQEKQSQSKSSGSRKDVADTDSTYQSRRSLPGRVQTQHDLFDSTSSNGRSENVANTQSLHSNVSGEHTEQSKRQISKPREGNSKITMANANSKGLQGQRRQHELVSQRETEHSVGRGGKEVRVGEFWKSEPRVGRVANGIPRRVDRLKGLGNAIVPAIAMRIGLTIKETM